MTTASSVNQGDISAAQPLDQQLASQMRAPDEEQTTVKSAMAERERKEAPTLAAVPKRSAFGSLLSRQLPNYGGPYQVGVRDIELDVPHRSFGHFIHKNEPHKEAGISLDTVLFTLFYPTKSKPPSTETKRVVWFPKLAQTIDGFMRMARRAPNWFYRAIAYPLAAAAIWGTTFPAERNVPLLEPPSDQGIEKWPVIIFSHGVGCSRLMYSVFCGEMASRGFIVAGIEHRDGSGPSTTIELEDGKTKILDWLDWRDVEWPDLAQQPKDDTTLRHAQLEMRLAELNQTVTALRTMASGTTLGKVAHGRSRKLELQEWAAMDLDRLIVAGHSFGGTMALAAALENKIHFESVIAFDPAVQRMEDRTGNITSPLLVINSEEFTKSADFDRLTKLRRSASSSSVFSIAGSTHPSFSDVHLILPGFINRRTGLQVEAQTVFDLSIPAVLAFIQKDYAGVRKMAAPQISNPTGTPGLFIWHEEDDKMPEERNLTELNTMATVEQVMSD